MKVAALAGGVGGAKLADGLAKALPPGDLTVIVNTGDDFEYLGLKICPDLDTVCYTLAGLANPNTGWGRKDETWNAYDSLVALGGPDWFHLGDRDLGTHLERTRRIKDGQSLSEITGDFCRRWGIESCILPMTNASTPTQVFTEEGILDFQEYFVHQQSQPRVSGFRFQGIEKASPAPGVAEAIQEAGLVVICPSNPWVSIGPILALPGLRKAVASQKTVAVSPIIGGQAVKGPAAKMYAELGIKPSALAVAEHYGSASKDGILTGFVLDQQDEDQARAIQKMGIETLVTGTLMLTSEDRQRLAQEVIDFGRKL